MGKQKRPDFPVNHLPFQLFDGKVWRNRQIGDMNREEVETILERVSFQIKMIHDLPTLDKVKPQEYMHETLCSLRKICIDLHWRSIELLK